MSKKYRLVTRSDMDGLVCGTLLKFLDIVEEVTFVHPKDMQDGLIKITDNDITTNLPYVEGVYLAFDHHLSETIRNEKRANHIIDPKAPSAAQVVYDYYDGDNVFPGYFTGLINGANKADSADFNYDDIVNPRAWALLSFLMDSRTGLGRFRNFRISNYQLMMDLIDYCGRHNIDQILELPDVKERVEIYFKYEEEFKEQLKRCAKVYGNLVTIDYRDEEIIYPGNRFMIYTLFPEQNISIHIFYAKNREKIVYSTGKSILNKTSKTNIGELMLKYEGGGHENAGACQILEDEAEQVLQELIKKINEDG